MKNFIQNFLIYLYSKRKNDFEIQSLPNLLKVASNVLIILPEEKELINDIKFLISVIDKLFKQRTFLLSQDIYNLLDLDQSISTITYTKDQINFIKLPKKNFIKSLQSKNFDTIIDCNLIDSNFHYWLTKNINAKYKIGLYRKNSTLFNNLVMKIKNIENTRSIYENFLYILKL